LTCKYTKHTFDQGNFDLTLVYAAEVASAMATANSQPHPIPELLTLSKALEAPERLASGSQEIQDAALGAAKFIFDLCALS